jgi:acyl carrier protein
MPSVPRSNLKRLFVDTLILGPEVDVEELKFNGVKAWDSVAHMALVAALETEFDVMLDTDEVLDLSSFKKCVEILGKYGLEIVA